MVELINLTLSTVRNRRPYFGLNVQYTVLPPQGKQRNFKVVPSDRGDIYEGKTKEEAILRMVADRMGIELQVSPPQKKSD